MHARLLASLLAFATVAGCVGGDDPDVPAPPVAVPDAPVVLGDLLNATLRALPNMTFEAHVVDAAVSVANDLYEPTIDVCDDGSIYITGHTILVDTTGAPVFGSHDDGKSWEQLPFFQTIASPASLQGATPPPSDEIFLSCGDGGWLYGVDITLATFPVNAWSDFGGRHAYHNPNAYDEAEVTDASTETSCVPAPAKDRPWGAYANGTLLMVSNPASGPAQIGILDVPPALPISLGATVGGASWNLCAGPGDLPASCNIPGVPDLRADGLFVVPQRCEGELVLTIGDKADVDAVQHVPVFAHTSGGEITSVYGHAVFDADGTLFVGITNNTVKRESRPSTSPLGGTTTLTTPVDGRMHFAVSTDDGQTFANRTFTMPGAPMRHFYMDANEKGPGALVVWAVDGETKDADNTTTAWDWYVGHLQLGADGTPQMTGVYLAIDEGPQPSAHVTGAAVGPDGRAYLAMYEGVARGGTPLSVYVQRAGPTMPLA